eukprot:1112068-Rhodomonas_salina.1
MSTVNPRIRCNDLGNCKQRIAPRKKPCTLPVVGRHCQHSRPVLRHMRIQDLRTIPQHIDKSHSHLLPHTGQRRAPPVPVCLPEKRSKVAEQLSWCQRSDFSRTVRTSEGQRGGAQTCQRSGVKQGGRYYIYGAKTHRDYQ